MWILDGAAIHCDPNIVVYLRSLGIICIFLPAYAPFFNPIEVMFGLMKRYLRQIYQENTNDKLDFFIGKTVKYFTGRNLRKIFQTCGYIANGKFDPAPGLNQHS